MLVLFEFEKTFYAQRGLEVDFVGHPFVDTVRATMSKNEIFRPWGLSEQNMTIGILPGSRQKEIETMLPHMMDAANWLHQKYPHIQFLVLKAPSINRQTIEEYLSQSSLPITLIDNNIYDAISACDLCMVTSGTATLETALLNKPMVIVYRTSFLTWILARLLIKIPDIGLVNVVAGRRIVPEYVKDYVSLNTYM